MAAVSVPHFLLPFPSAAFPSSRSRRNSRLVFSNSSSSLLTRRLRLSSRENPESRPEDPAVAAGDAERIPSSTEVEEKPVTAGSISPQAGSTVGGVGGGFWDGVGEEISEIEWPGLGKVVGTTGVVLAVIAGSTVALLSVNALLAELSDRVFAGRGLQDFF